MKKAKRKSVTLHSKLQIPNTDKAGPSGSSSSHSQKLSSRQDTKGSCGVRSDLDIVSGFAFLSFTSLPELEAHLASNELKPTTLSLSVGQKRKSTTEISSENVSLGNISISSSKKTIKAPSKQPCELSEPSPCMKSKSKYLNATAEIGFGSSEEHYVNNFGQKNNREVAVVKEKKKYGEKISNFSCVATVTKEEGGKDATSQGIVTESSFPTDESVGSCEKKKKRRIQTSGCQTGFRIKKKPKQTEKLWKTSRKVDERGSRSQDSQNSNFGEEMLMCTENSTGMEGDLQSCTLNREHVGDPLKMKTIKSEDIQKAMKKAGKRPKIEKIEWCARSGGFDSLRKYRLLNKKDDEPAVTSGQQCKTYIQLNTISQDEELLSEGNTSSFDFLDVPCAGRPSKGKIGNTNNKTLQNNSESEMEDLIFINRTDLDSSIADDSAEDYSSSDIEFLESKASRDKDRMLGNTPLTITKASDGEEEVDVSTITGNDKPVSFLVVNCGSHSTLDGPVGHFSRHPEATVEGTVDVSIQAYAGEIEVFMKFAMKQPGQIVKIVSPDSSDISGIAQIPKYLRDPDKIKSVRSFTERKRRHAIGHLFNGIKSEVFGNDEDAEMYISKQAILDKAILTILTLQRNGLELCKKKFLLRKRNEELANRVKELRDDRSSAESSDDVDFVSAVSQISLEEIAKEIEELEEQLGGKIKFWTQFKETSLRLFSDHDATKQCKSDDASTVLTPINMKLGRNSRASDELKMALGIKPAVPPPKGSAKLSLVKESKTAASMIMTDPLTKTKTCSIVQPAPKPTKKTKEPTKEQIICNLSRSGEGPANFRFVTNAYNLKEMESKNVIHIKITNDVLNKLQGEAGKHAVGKHLDQVKLATTEKSPDVRQPEIENQTTGDSRSKADGDSKEDVKQVTVNVNLEKSNTTAPSKNLAMNEACNEGQPTLVKATAGCATEMVEDSKCQKKPDLETLPKFSDSSCNDQKMDIAPQHVIGDTRKIEHLKPQSKSNVVEISPICHFTNLALCEAEMSSRPVSATAEVLKEPACSSVTIHQTPKVTVLNQNNSKYPTGHATHLVKPSSTNPSPVQITKDTTGKLPSVALNKEHLVQAKGEERFITTSSSDYLVMASTTLPTTGNAVNIQSTKVTQVQAKEYSASQTPCTVGYHQLPRISTTAQQTVFLRKLDCIKNAVSAQGASTLQHSVPKVVVKPGISSQHSRQLPEQFVGNPVITKPVTASRHENPKGSFLKKVIIQPTNNPSGAAQLQSLRTNALNSPIVVKNATPTNIQITQVAHPLQGTGLKNAQFATPYVVRVVNNNQPLSSAPKAQHLNPVQASSSSSVPSLSVRLNEASGKSVNQAASFSSFPISQAGNWVTACSGKTTSQANHGALNSLPVQAKLALVSQQSSCMQVPLDSSACSTPVNQPSSGHPQSIPSQATYYNVSRGTVLPYMQPARQGNAPVNIAKHFIPVNLPVAQKNQVDPLVSLKQYSTARQAVKRRESVPAKTPLRDILPAVSGLSCNTKSSVCGEVIDDLSDIQSIIGSLPTPVCTEHAVPSMSSEFQPQVAVSPVSNLRASAQNSSSSSFGAFATNTMAASSNIGALSVAASQFPVQNTFSAVNSVLTGQPVDKNFNYDSFLSNSKPKQVGSNQDSTSFLESTPVQELLNINPRNTGQNTEHQCSPSTFDIDQCVNELLKSIGHKGVP